MTTLLEIKEKLRQFYGKYEVFVTPVLKFIMSLIIFLMINSSIGYMSAISRLPIAIILALVCSVIPVNGTIFIATLVMVLDFYALSIEVCLVALILFFLLYLVYFRFAPKHGYNVVLTTVCFKLNIPYIMPVASGL